MNNITLKSSLLYSLFFMIGSYSLAAANLTSQPTLPTARIDRPLDELSRAKCQLLVQGYCNTYNIPKEIVWIITYFVHNSIKYKNKSLPPDLSGLDLTGFDFTGCHFTCTNLTDSMLKNTILTNTTCDYRTTFLSNIKKNNFGGDHWYQENLEKDLQKIAEVYPKLQGDAQKAQLLAIASGLARLPFYHGTEFYIKVQYWSAAFLALYDQQNNLDKNDGICSLEIFLSYDALLFCWGTNYPAQKITIDHPAPHANFDQYLQDFTNGLIQYSCQSKYNWGFSWYKYKITENIKSLQKAYPQVKQKAIQLEMCQIAHQLSKSYRVAYLNLLRHFLQQQNRLIRLKSSVDPMIKNLIFYEKIFGTKYIRYHDDDY